MFVNTFLSIIDNFFIFTVKQAKKEHSAAVLRL